MNDADNTVLDLLRDRVRVLAMEKDAIFLDYNKAVQTTERLQAEVHALVEAVRILARVAR